MKRTPHETNSSWRTINRRALLIGGAQVGFAGLLALRMRHLQVDQADQFRLLAEENRINMRLIPPSRGDIFDRNGVVLAENEPSYRITLVAEDAGDVDDVLAKLSKQWEQWKQRQQWGHWKQWRQWRQWRQRR